MEKFIVKRYSSDERPIIKGNGFDGLVVGDDREEAEEFIAFVNNLITGFNGGEHAVLEDQDYNLEYVDAGTIILSRCR